MKKRRALLFSAQRLLGESLEQTMSGIPGFEVAGHYLIDDQVMSRLATARADLVILADEGCSHQDLTCLTSEMIERYPDLPVFRVALEQNVVQVYRSHILPARSIDLVELIQHLPFKTTDKRTE